MQENKSCETCRDHDNCDGEIHGYGNCWRSKPAPIKLLGETVLTEHKTSSDFLTWHPSSKISRTRLTERDIRMIKFARSEIARWILANGITIMRGEQPEEYIALPKHFIAELEGK